MTSPSISSVASSWHAPIPRRVEPTRSAPTQGDSCDARCASTTGGSGLLDDLPGSVPYATFLAKGNRRARVIEAAADATGPNRSPDGTGHERPPAGPDLGWPKLGDAPMPERVVLVRTIQRVYRVVRITQPGATLDLIG